MVDIFKKHQGVQYFCEAEESKNDITEVRGWTKIMCILLGHCEEFGFFSKFRGF